MRHWSQWALFTAMVLPVAGVLVYHARGRLQRSQSLEGQPILLCESCAETKGILARTRAKARMAHEVIAGRLSLLQAAAAFRDLDERWPRAVNPWAAFPDASEDESYCLKVIGYVDTEAPSDRASPLTRRLHVELDAMLRNGTLHLPDSDDGSTSDGG
jgi:hypothetical protein